MAYLFNNDKSKSEVVVIKGTATSVAPETTKDVSITAAALRSYGINDIFDYMPISAVQYTDSSTFEFQPDKCPLITFYTADSEGEIRLVVYNPEATVRPVHYKIVLMKAE